MDPIILPTRTDYPHYEFEIDLEDVTFIFEFMWNGRDEAWYMSIFDVTKTPLLSGRKVVLGFPLLSRFRDPRLPKGEINAIDTTGSNIEPGLSDLGARVRLLYEPSTTLEPDLVS